MPNWCGNTLTLGHDDPEMIVRAKQAFIDGRLLGEFIPVPKDLQITAGTVGASDSPEQQELERQERHNRATHGYANWYDFCTAEWGTKWDVGDSQGIQTWDENELVVYFDSAWAPPCAAYEKLQEQGFRVYATYYEPGCGFAGIYDDEFGDNYYDLSGMDSGDVKQQLPPELDDAFGISDAMADWEGENEDEVTTWYKDGVKETGLEPHEPPKK
jgi:hypothetical protein